MTTVDQRSLRSSHDVGPEVDERLVDLPRYDWLRTYDWNYDHAPEPLDIDVATVPGPWRFCGLPVDSPLGVPAGPLLNSRWLLYYASLGFDALVYKTVRSLHRASYPLPNLQPIRCESMLTGSESGLPICDAMRGSWAVSFGMPSKAPEVWRADVELARSKLPRNKVLIVSVVGSVQPGWTIDDLACDYSKCARWAVDSGADAVEANFSCPNVATCDGQLYLDFSSARIVAATVRAAVGKTPLIIKIGHVKSDDDAAQLLDALSDQADGLAMTNCIASTVATADGRPVFDNHKRGICGTAIRQASVAQVHRFSRLVAARASRLALIGVGGAATTDDICSYLAAGAQSVHIATAAIQDPSVAIHLRRKLDANAGKTTFYGSGLLPK